MEGVDVEAVPGVDGLDGEGQRAACVIGHAHHRAGSCRIGGGCLHHTAAIGLRHQRHVRRGAGGAIRADELRLAGDDRTIGQRDVGGIALEADLHDAEFGQRPGRLRAISVGDHHLEGGELYIRRRQPAIAIAVEHGAQRVEVACRRGVPLGEDVFAGLADPAIAIGIEEQYAIARGRPGRAVQEAVIGGVHEHVGARHLGDRDAIAIEIEQHRLGAAIGGAGACGIVLAVTLVGILRGAGRLA